MANYSEKLANMRLRRTGTSSSALDKSLEFAESTSFREAYESRAKTEAIKYALGAMQELEKRYTEISIEEGERVREQLNNGLRTAGIGAQFEYQGSVPLNIHIRFASDIDLLVLHDGFVTIDRTGPRANTYRDVTPGHDITTEMLKLRLACERILDQKFPAAKVDKSGAKSISLTGGSLRRKVDVVPSHWHDTKEYQISGKKYDREVKVFDKDLMTRITNRPFLHMHRVEIKDKRTNGGTKKVIRLLKNIKNDSSFKHELSSYDLVSIVWHMNEDALNKPYYLELSLVAEVQKYLKFLVENPVHAKQLIVPDESRKILDSDRKFESLRQLKIELDELLEDIARELNPLLSNRALAVQQLLEAKVF